MQVAVRVFNSCDKASAIPHFTNHLKNNPNDGMGYYYRGLSNDIIGNSAEAAKDYSKGLAKADNYAHKKFIITKMLYNQNELDSALMEAKKVVANDNRFGDIWSVMGDIYFQQELIDKSFEAYRTAIDLKAVDSNWLYKNMGDYYFKNGDLDKANDMYDAAIDLCDCFTIAYVCKAQVAAKRRAWNVYEECIRSAMTYNPKVVDNYRDSITDEVEKSHFLTSIKDVQPDTQKTFAFRNNGANGKQNQNAYGKNNSSGSNGNNRNGNGNGNNGDDGGNGKNELLNDYNDAFEELKKSGTLKENFSDYEKIATKRCKLEDNPSIRLYRVDDFDKIKGTENKGKIRKGVWISPIPPQSQHGQPPPQYKVYIETGSSFHFAGSIERNGRPLLNKNESNKGLVIPKNKIINF